MNPDGSARRDDLKEKALLAGKKYGHLKLDTAELVVNAVAPIREETERLLADRPYLDTVLSEGAERARERALRTLREVAAAVGFVPPRD